MTHPTYPSCPLSDRYSILLRIPPEDRPAIVERVEAGLPLTPEECTHLGLFPCDSLVLTPDKGVGTKAQVMGLFAGDLNAFKNVAQMRQAKRRVPVA